MVLNPVKIIEFVFYVKDTYLIIIYNTYTISVFNNTIVNFEIFFYLYYLYTQYILCIMYIVYSYMITIHSGNIEICVDKYFNLF